MDGLSCYQGVCAQVGGETGEEGGGDGDGDGENLFADPSFEGWAGMSHAIWEASQATLTPESADVHDGELAARFASDSYGSLGQSLGFSPPVGGDQCLHASAWVSYVEGDPQPIAILMSGTNDEGEDFQAGGGTVWTPNGEWQKIERLIVPVGTVSSAIVFFSAPSDPQTWLIDDARLERVPCP